MIEKQLKTRGITDQKILTAMLQVPRHIFVPEKYLTYAYEDSALPIDENQSISQPYIVAKMIQELSPREDDRILEIGTGSGYAAAVLSQICRKVYTIERHEILAKQAIKRFKNLGYTNIEVKIGDGTKGWQKRAPFHKILISAGAPIVPKGLIKQLKVNGVMIIPVGQGKKIQNLYRINRNSKNKTQTEELEAVRFVPLIGQEGWDE